MVFGLDATTSLPHADTDLDDLQKRLIRTLTGFHQNMVDEAVDQWRTRLDVSVRATAMIRLLRLLTSLLWWPQDELLLDYSEFWVE